MALVATAAVVVVACGGADDNLSIPSGDDGGADVFTPDGTGDDGSPPDTGGGETGTDCTNAGSRGQCLACCVQAYPGGAAVLVQAEAQCACVPELCGAVEAGTAGGDAGDDAAASDGGGDDGAVEGGGVAADGGGGGGDGGASLLGTGACAATCSGGAPPDPTCRKCLSEATGTKQNPGHCFSVVSAACQANTDCTSYVACASTCK